MSDSYRSLRVLNEGTDLYAGSGSTEEAIGSAAVPRRDAGSQALNRQKKI